ncbi:MAG: cysteine hydrolase [Eggerthellaceae bacterium]|nr:cysteine hydrolase [Eggerthellaceae bacterium]
MKRLLIVVDYQNDFVDGALGFEGAELLDERIAGKIDEYREAGDHIAFTFDTHHKDYLETFEGVNLPIPHCIEGTEGHELYGQVATKLHDSDDVFLKPTFGSTALFERLMKRQSVAVGIGAQPFESIELVGLVSNMCVLSNAVIARTACPNVPIIVDAMCTASPDPVMNEKAFDILEGLQIRVVNRDKSALAEANEGEETPGSEEPIA